MPSFYIVLQKEIPALDLAGAQAQALAKNNPRLAALAEGAGVRPLMSFFSINDDEIYGPNEGFTKEEREHGLEEKWYAPEEGLKTISELKTALASDSSAENSDLLLELNSFQQILEAARSHNIRWHLGFDY